MQEKEWFHRNGFVLKFQKGGHTALERRAKALPIIHVCQNEAVAKGLRRLCGWSNQKLLSINKFGLQTSVAKLISFLQTFLSLETVPPKIDLKSGHTILQFYALKFRTLQKCRDHHQLFGGRSRWPINGSKSVQSKSLTFKVMKS